MVMKRDPEIELFRAKTDISLPLPFVEDGISAGVFSTAENWLEPVMDLNEAVIKNPASTFIGRIRGRSLEGIFLYDRDLIIIDNDYSNPKDYDLIVCIMEGKLAVRYYKKEGKNITLKSANNLYKPLLLNELENSELTVKIIGKVTWTFSSENNYKKRLQHFDRENH